MIAEHLDFNGFFIHETMLTRERFSVDLANRYETWWARRVEGAESECEVRFCWTITVGANGGAKVQKFEFSELAENDRVGKDWRPDHGKLSQGPQFKVLRRL
jgi:hypothetical protein